MKILISGSPYSYLLCLCLTFLHEGIADVFGGQEVFLDGARADPAQKVQDTAGFIVSARLLIHRKVVAPLLRRWVCR